MNLFKEKSESAIITLPNIVTVAGLLLIIPYVWGFLTEHRWVLGISLFLSGFTDLLDGMLAKKLKQATILGKILDPARDRLLLLAILANLIYIGGAEILLGWGGILIAAELGIIIKNCLLNSIQKAKVHLAGKLRQAGHLIIAGLVLLNFYSSDILVDIGIRFDLPIKTALMIMGILSLVAFASYVANGRKK